MTNPQPSLTPEQLLALLTQELSASGSILLTSENGGPPLTFREAVAAILWKQTTLLPLTNRPVPPTTPDDNYGHILSTHAITLQLLALVAAIATQMNIPVTDIMTAVGQAL